MIRNTQLAVKPDSSARVCWMFLICHRDDYVTRTHTGKHSVHTHSTLSPPQQSRDSGGKVKANKSEREARKHERDEDCEDIVLEQA